MTHTLSAIWRYRYFWASLVRMDLRLRYRRTALGIGWSLLHPIALTIVFCVVFSNWMGNKEWWIAAPYFLAGLAIWEYVKGSILAGCECFFQNEPYIRQCPLPLAIYPLLTVLGTSIHFLFALGVVLLAISVLHQSGKAFTVLWAVFPALLLLFVFAWSAAVVAAFVTVHFHDVKHLLEVVFQLFFFLTPIMYEKQMLYEKGVGWLADYNPVIVFFDLIREPMLTGTTPATALYGEAAGIVAVALAAAIALISRLEKRLIFYL